MPYQRDHRGELLTFPNGNGQNGQNYQPEIEENLLQRTSVQVMVKYFYQACHLYAAITLMPGQLIPDWRLDF